MRIIASIGRMAFDLETQWQSKAKAKASHVSGDIEVHEIESAISGPIIGFVPNDDEDEGDDS